MEKPEFEPINIKGIIEEGVTRPRNDGTRGSGLYNVPLQLSRRPPTPWDEYFVHAWDHPSSWTSMHRPGICRISGDRVWLDGTTLEEIESTHKETLKLALDEANKKYPEYVARANAERERLREEAEAHKAHVSEAAKRIKFD
jgi:hypothetical protein